MLFWWKVPDRYAHDTLTLKLSKKGLESNDTRKCDRLVDKDCETRTGWDIKVNITLWPLLFLSPLPLFSFPSKVLGYRKPGLTLPLRKWHTASSLWFWRGKKIPFDSSAWWFPMMPVFVNDIYGSPFPDNCLGKLCNQILIWRKDRPEGYKVLNLSKVEFLFTGGEPGTLFARLAFSFAESEHLEYFSAGLLWLIACPAA